LKKKKKKIFWKLLRKNIKSFILLVKLCFFQICSSLYTFFQVEHFLKLNTLNQTLNVQLLMKCNCCLKTFKLDCFISNYKNVAILKLSSLSQKVYGGWSCGWIELAPEVFLKPTLDWNFCRIGPWSAYTIFCSLSQV
jgi:hypothetical protein